jgi:lipoprotein-anchoring transpeptidase ErfK/SrfK
MRATAWLRKLHRHSAFRLGTGSGLVLLLLCAMACHAANGPAPSVTTDPAALASIKVEPAPGARDIDPVAPVSVTAQSGTLTDVQMINDAGKRVDGTLTPDNVAWHPVVPLGYAHTYTITINSRGPGGKPGTQSVSFTTLTPPNQTKVSFRTTSEAALADGGTYGVGVVIVAHFDESIANRAEAERRLIVTTSPPVTGSWYWVDDQNAHWRPEHYYSPGMTVTVEAKIYGIPLAQGLFGQQDERVSFKIGESHVSVADDRTKQVSVSRNGTLVRTMPTSMGMGGTEQIGGRTLSFWTPPGIYTVLDKGNPVVMDSSTFGLPKNLRAAQKLPPRLSRNHQLRHPHQHRRHLHAPARCHGVGSRQHRHQPRLPESQRRQRQMVLRLLGTGRCRRGAQHRRAAPCPGAERRLDRPVGSVAQGQRVGLALSCYAGDQTDASGLCINRCAATVLTTPTTWFPARATCDR